MDKGIHFIGRGKIVKTFLNLTSNNKSITTSGKDDPVQMPHEHIFLCASVNEVEILQQSADPYDRLSVALPNLHLVNSLIKKGYFDDGIVFVMTNPSEVIAEYIYRKTGNQKIFALGLEADCLRLANLLEVDVDRLQVGGHHYNNPCAYYKEKDSDLIINYPDLNERLKESIKMEFSGQHPPTSYGAVILQKAYEAIQKGSTIKCSAYVQNLDCFCGGVLNLSSSDFIPSLGNTSLSKNFILDCIKQHKNTFSILVKELL